VNILDFIALDLNKLDNYICVSAVGLQTSFVF